MSSINAVLTRLGKNLAPGETITFTLVKGPSSVSSDPVSTTDKRTPALAFPRIAKFIDTVVKPDFENRFRNGRLFEENVPTAKDDSDDENENEMMIMKDDDGNIIPKNPNKKKKRWRRYDAPRRHWVLCEEEEYQAKIHSQANEFPRGGSYRYEGVPEYNNSNYVLLSLRDNHYINSGLQLNVQTVHGFHSFSQPTRMANVTMQQVEQEITAKRAVFKKHIMQSKKLIVSQNSAAAASRMQSSLHPSKIRKARLFQKLAKGSGVGDDDDNDVMGDLAFRNKETSTMGIKAREELLSDMADENVLVDGNGVLGGSGVNDSEFGGGGRFGSFRGGGRSSASAQQRSAANAAKRKAMAASDIGKGQSASTFDGSAMASDFYTRDVSAEYEDLDYDPTEQFDDDDQDMGEGEISMIDQGGFVGDGSDDENDDDGEDAGDSSSGGGLATKAGYMAFMAKTRGEGIEENTIGVIPTSQNIAISKKMDPTNLGSNTNVTLDKDSNKSSLPNHSNITQKPIVRDITKPARSTTAKEPLRKKPKHFSTKDAGVAVDASGQRIIDLVSVRKEIWLHNQQIPLKKLGKIFGVSMKSSKERRSAFKACLKELCTVVDDPVEGEKICRLKQHYSNMGSG